MKMKAKDLYLKSEKYVRELLIEKLPENSQIFLFGSRASGKSGFASDLDIGIISNTLDQKKLGEIQSLIEESFVPFKVDLVDFSKVDSEFKKQALKNIVQWK